MTRPSRRVIRCVLGATATVIVGVAILLQPSPAAAADCDVSRFTGSDGTVDITSYLQCSTPELSDETVAPGASVTFEGGGFKARSTITITVHSDPIVLGTTTADGSGNFSVTVTIPASVPLGSHHLEASGLDPSGRPLSVSLPLTIGTAGSGGALPGGPLPSTGTDIARSIGVGAATLILGTAALAAGRARHTS